MANVEQRAEAEASKKGLEGGARRAYVGGVFNRIRQAHASAPTRLAEPGPVEVRVATGRWDTR